MPLPPCTRTLLRGGDEGVRRIGTRWEWCKDGRKDAGPPSSYARCLSKRPRKVSRGTGRKAKAGSGTSRLDLELGLTAAGIDRLQETITRGKTEPFRTFIRHSENSKVAQKVNAIFPFPTQFRLSKVPTVHMFRSIIHNSSDCVFYMRHKPNSEPSMNGQTGTSAMPYKSVKCPTPKSLNAKRKAKKVSRVQLTQFQWPSERSLTAEESTGILPRQF